MYHSLRHKLANLMLPAALLLGLFPSAVLTTHTAQAEGISPAGVQSRDATPSEEIVFVDGNGFIRVLDIQTDGGPTVDWVSPVGNWRTFALGDFNADGDKEIVAIGGGSTDGKLTVYDPVVSKGVRPDDPKTQNGIPWRILYQTALPNSPTLVAASNFDPSIPGDEILYIRKLSSGESQDKNDLTRLTILKATSLTPDGTSWTPHLQVNHESDWNVLTAGPLDTTGADEFGLVSDENGKLEIYTLDGGHHRILDVGGSTKRSKGLTFAQFVGGGNSELAMTREVDPPLQSLLIFSFAGGTFSDLTGEAFAPEFTTVFAGDINGSGDDEIIMLRSVDDGVRLIVRGAGSDAIVQGFLDGLPLDSNNGYRSGAAGDIDADGKDEIVIMRDNNIRYYPNAHNSTGSVDFGTTTNRRAIAIGDLDRNGFVAGPQFVANPNQIPVTVDWGYSFSGSFTLQNGATNDPVSFAASIEGNPFGLTLQPTSNIAPGVNGGTTTINYTIDGTKLAPNTVYPYVVRIDNTSALPVTNTPYRIPITATVKMPELRTIPDNAVALIYPCQEPLTEQQLTFEIRGVFGLELTNITVASAAQVASAADNQSAVTAQPEQSLAVEGITAGNLITSTTVPWITSMSVPTTTIPTTLTLTISPTARTKDIDLAYLTVRGVESGVPYQSKYPTQIQLLCANSAAWLPVIQR